MREAAACMEITKSTVLLLWIDAWLHSLPPSIVLYIHYFEAVVNTHTHTYIFLSYIKNKFSNVGKADIINDTNLAKTVLFKSVIEVERIFFNTNQGFNH